MSSSGNSSNGGGGVDDPQWIDRILDRAVDSAVVRADDAGLDPTMPLPIVPEAPLPIVPDPVAALAAGDSLGEIRWVDAPLETPAPAPEPRPATPPAAAPRPATPPAAAPRPAAPPTSPPIAANGDRGMATPSSTPIVAVGDLGVAAPVTPASTPIAPQRTTMTAQDVGRSAWAEELVGNSDADPVGWDQLSWQDLEDRGSPDDDPLDGNTTALGRVLREWGPVLIIAVTIAIVTRLFLVQAYHIPSLSMFPTLEVGDRVIVNRLSYQFGEIDRGQVVVFSKPITQPDGADDLIKRVIGLPGETVRFSEGNVYIDGDLVVEPYLAEELSTRARSFSIPGCAQQPASNEMCVVPEGYVFVMGDNRRGSSDSRVFGPVPIDTVVGRAFVRVWPLNSIDWL